MSHDIHAPSRLFSNSPDGFMYTSEIATLLAESFCVKFYTKAHEIGFTLTFQHLKQYNKML